MDHYEYLKADTRGINAGGTAGQMLSFARPGNIIYIPGTFIFIFGGKCYVQNSIL